METLMTPQEPPRYPSYRDPSVGWVEGGFDPSVPPYITIMNFAPAKEWHAVWFGPGIRDGLHGEFDGSREDAIAWSRQRCTDILIWSPEHQDVIALEDCPMPNDG
jgi:hypothetical protein